jgi:hypothetical protein
LDELLAWRATATAAVPWWRKALRLFLGFNRP